MLRNTSRGASWALCVHSVWALCVHCLCTCLSVPECAVAGGLSVCVCAPLGPQDFPYNLEPYLLDRELRVPKGPERKAITVRLAFKQLLEALAAAHSTGEREAPDGQPGVWSHASGRKGPPRTAAVSARRLGGHAGQCGPGWGHVPGEGHAAHSTGEQASTGACGVRAGAGWGGAGAAAGSSHLCRRALPLPAGIVHRDVKPENCIVSDRGKKIKLIDLGAAADLRIGVNYAPNEYLLDPR